jgi:hypothetical protein
MGAIVWTPYWKRLRDMDSLISGFEICGYLPDQIHANLPPSIRDA